MAEKEEELKSLLIKEKEEIEKVGLKLNIQITKIMASGPITSWQINGETVTDFIFPDSKITVDGDCSHEIKRCLLLGRKGMTNLDSILQRHYFAKKGPSSQSYGFSSSHVWTIVSKVMSLLFNMLSRLVINFLPRSKKLLFHGCSHHLQ